MAAATAVFDTYELFEHILKQLPLADALTMTRVRKSCRDVFERSPHMRRLPFESELPPCNSIVNGVLVNRDKFSPWILRTQDLCKSRTLRGKGQFFIFSTPSTRYIIYCPENSGENLVSNGISLDMTKWEAAVSTRSWVPWCSHWVHMRRIKSHVFERYLLLIRGQSRKVLRPRLRQWSGEMQVFGPWA